MMRVLLVALLSACCPHLDGETEVDPPPSAARVIETVGDFYALEIGEHREVGFRWSSTVMSSAEGEGITGFGARCGDLWVYVGPAWRRSVAHEMAHCYAGDIGDHCWTADNSHGDERWWARDGLMVQAVELVGGL